MHLKNLWLCCTLIVICLPLFGQQPAAGLSPVELEQMDLYEDTLAVLGYAIVNDSLADNRFLACREMIVRLKQA